MHWSLVLAAAAAVGTTSATVDIGPIPAAGSGEVLKLNSEAHDRLTVPVTISGMGPFDFVLDTGAQATVLSTALADRLMLTDRKSATLVGMASTKPVETTYVPDFALGSRTFAIRIAPLVSAANIGGADGILGIDSLQGQRVLLDFKNKRISVADARQLGGDKGYEIVVTAQRRLGQLIITHAKIDGVRTAVLVDTGSELSVGNMALFEKLNRRRQAGQMMMIDVNGVSLSGPARMGGDLSIGSASISNFAIGFADAPTFRTLGLTKEPALILGMSELRVFKRVAIDFQQRRILFDLPTSAMINDSLLYAHH
jgi:predicted aspartyl protease